MQLSNVFRCLRVCILICFLLLLLQHRRELRLALVAKFREKQNMKQLQKLKSKEDPALIPKDPTEEVFETPAEEKPMEIELVRPEPKMSLKKKKKKVHQRQRKWKRKLGRIGVQN